MSEIQLPSTSMGRTQPALVTPIRRMSVGSLPLTALQYRGPVRSARRTEVCPERFHSVSGILSQLHSALAGRTRTFAQSSVVRYTDKCSATSMCHKASHLLIQNQKAISAK